MTTDSEMVERLGHAVCHFQRKCPGKPCQECLERARAALKAMREPTWQMCSAGSMKHCKMVEDGDADANEPDCRHIFEAMINAALTTEEE